LYKTLAPGAIGVRVPFPEAVALAARHGFEGITVDYGTLEEMGLDSVRKLLDSHGVRPALTGMPVRLREDQATFEKDLVALPPFARAMQDLGCTRAATWFPPFHETLTYAEQFAQMRDRLEVLCDVIRPYGLCFGLEFIGPETFRKDKRNPFIHDLPGLLELIKAVDRDNLGVLLDAWHWYTSGGTATQLDLLTDQRVIVVHVNDAPPGIPLEEQIDQVRALPGETGVIPLDTFMGALVDMGYSGPVMVEPFSERLRLLAPEDAVAETARALDSIWPAS
jgi:sugar phosphate isomerase/epimerase